MKKQYTLGRFLLVGGACLLAAVLLTMQFCYRYMYLLPKEKQERQYAELSQQLELVNADGKSYRNLAAKFQAVYELYTEKELTEADEEELERELLKAFVSLIGDRYAAYYTAEEYTSLLNSTSGQSKGYGITITKNATGGMVTTYVEKDSPAEKAGFRAGEEILRVNGQALSQVGYDKAAESIAQGEQCTFTVKREGVEHDILLQKEEITVSSVHFELREGQIGYIRILSFRNSGVQEFKRAVDALTEAGAKALILDVRSNGGGTLTAVHKMLDYLLPDTDAEGEERVVVSLTDKRNNVTQYTCSDEHEVAVDIDVFSRDFAQESVLLKDGSAVKLTSSAFLPPSGKSFDGVGLVPDLETDDSGVNIYLVPYGQDPTYSAAEKLLEG